MAKKHKLFFGQGDKKFDSLELDSDSMFGVITMEIHKCQYDRDENTVTRVFTMSNAKRLQKWLNAAIKKASKK
jgi:hypothetical protein